MYVFVILLGSSLQPSRSLSPKIKRARAMGLTAFDVTSSTRTRFLPNAHSAAHAFKAAPASGLSPAHSAHSSHLAHFRKPRRTQLGLASQPLPRPQSNSEVPPRHCRRPSCHRRRVRPRADDSRARTVRGMQELVMRRTCWH